MKKQFVILVTAVLMAGGANAGEAEIFAGKILAKSKCIGCHGTAEVPKAEGIVDIAGQEESYLVEQLKAFRMGLRRNLMMTPVATPLTDKEIVELAAYYASLKKN